MRLQTSYLASFSLPLLLLAAGCTNETEGDRARDRASIHQQGADLLKKGEADVDAGKSMMAEGQSMKDHGANVDGEKKMQQGQIMIDTGNSEMQHGRDMGNK